MKKYFIAFAAIVFLLLTVGGFVASQFELDNIKISTNTINQKIQEKLPLEKKISIYTLSINDIKVGTDFGLATNLYLYVDVYANIRKTGECFKIEPSKNKTGMMNILQNAASSLSKKCENLSNETSSVKSHTTGTIVYRGNKFYYLPEIVKVESDLKDNFLKINKSLIDKGMESMIDGYLSKRPVYSLENQKIISMAIESISIKPDHIVINISWLKLTISLIICVIIGLLGIGLIVILVFFKTVGTVDKP